MPVLVGSLKGGAKGKSLILNGHYDVVPVAAIENWSKDPFKGEAGTPWITLTPKP